MLMLPFVWLAGSPEAFRDGQFVIELAGIAPAVLWLVLEKLRRTKDLDTGGLSAPVDFTNPQQLAGTSVAVFQLDAKTVTFRNLTGFANY